MTTSTGVRVSDVEQALGKIREDGRCREAAVLAVGLGTVPGAQPPTASPAGPPARASPTREPGSNYVTTVRKSSTSGPMTLWKSHHPLMEANRSSGAAESGTWEINDDQQQLKTTLNHSGVPPLAPYNVASQSPDPVINSSKR